MAGYKLLKRKGVDEVTDDFYDFSLSSPATKIRRLDAELPPIEEVEVEEEQPVSPIAEENEQNEENEERALVLFKPLTHSPSSSPFSLSLNSDLISEIKNWSKHHDSGCDRIVRSQEQDKNNQHLALVPWMPSTTSSSRLAHLQDSSDTNTELMEAESDEMGGGGEAEPSMMMMDVEQLEQQDGTPSNTNFPTSTFHHPIYPTTLNLHHGIGGISAAAPEGFNQQWQQQQQQHCLLPQLPQNTSTPIAWTH